MSKSIRHSTPAINQGVHAKIRAAFITTFEAHNRPPARPGKHVKVQFPEVFEANYKAIDPDEIARQAKLKAFEAAAMAAAHAMHTSALLDIGQAVYRAGIHYLPEEVEVIDDGDNEIIMRRLPDVEVTF